MTTSGRILFLNELDQVPTYIEGLIKQIRPKVRKYHEQNPKEGRYDSAQYAPRHHWRHSRFVQRSAAAGAKTDVRNLMVYETGEQQGGQVNNLLGAGHPFNMDDGYTESDDDSYYCVEDETGAILNINDGRYSQKGQPRDNNFALTTRPEWQDESKNQVANDVKPQVSNRRPIRNTTICYSSFAKGDQYASGCCVDIQKNVRVIMAQFESLNAGEKTRTAFKLLLSLTRELPNGRLPKDFTALSQLTTE